MCRRQLGHVRVESVVGESGKNDDVLLRCTGADPAEFGRQHHQVGIENASTWLHSTATASNTR